MVASKKGKSVKMNHTSLSKHLHSKIKAVDTLMYFLVIELLMSDELVVLSSELVGALDTQKITMVSCGRAHSMVVNEQGQVFAWGAGEGGQLGLGTAELAVRIPR